MGLSQCLVMEEDHAHESPPSVTVQWSQRSLSETVPEALIQGIPVRCLLAGAGRSLILSEPADVQLRRCVTFDVFISHDWQTSRWLKYASLLLLFNAQPAAIATLVVSLTLAFLKHYEELQDTIWLMCGGYLTFIVFLLFWQNLRDMFVGPKLAFFDKLTIPQEDEKLKEQCILGLAAFLGRSQQLVVLWSESYIHRLWCLYELTTFMRLHGEGRPVRVLPVALPLLLLVHALWWLAVKLLATIVSVLTNRTGNENLEMLLVSICVLFFFFLTYPLQSKIGMRMTKNLQDLKESIKCFDVQQAKCSCCSQGHLAENGEPIPCDRRLIYQRFQSWHGEDPDTALAKLNATVKQKFGHQILQVWGSSMVPLDLFIYVVFSMNTPFLINRIPIALTLARQEASALQVFLVVARDLVRWANVFPNMLVYLWANKMIWSLQHSKWPILMSMISATIVFVTQMGANSLVYLSISWTSEDSWLPLIAFLFFFLLGLCLLNPRWCSRDVPQLPETKGEVKDDESDSFSI